MLSVFSFFVFCRMSSGFPPCLPVSIVPDAIRLFLVISAGCHPAFPSSYSAGCHPAFPSSCSAGCHPAFPSSCSAGCHPAFICSRSTLSCAREFRERVAIAFCPSLSCARPSAGACLPVSVVPDVIRLSISASPLLFNLYAFYLPFFVYLYSSMRLVYG